MSEISDKMDEDELKENEEIKDNNISNIEGNFTELGLDERLINGLLKHGFVKATLIQQKTIPIILNGKDVLLRAKTGSGKTLSYLIPLIQNILNLEIPDDEDILSIILAPSRELLIQISNVLNNILINCGEITHYVLKGFGNNILNNDKICLNEKPNIVISTPSQLALHIKHKNIDIKSVKYIIIDEADIIITNNYLNDVKIISNNMDNKSQIIMCSATLNTNTNELQKLFLMNNPVKLELNNDGFDVNKLSEYYMLCDDYNDKFVIIFSLFKLNIIKGKCIIFCHSIDLSYRIKLFLEHFMIKTAILNPKLPFNSRQSVIDKFNRGLFNYLITTDIFDEKMNNNNNNNNDNDGFIGYRGVDFREISCVINFSSPSWIKKYTHRVGRTARAGNYGVAITLVTNKEFPRFKDVMFARKDVSNNNNDSNIDFSSLIKPLPLKMTDLQRFKYRCASVRCGITPQIIKTAMINEIKMELINSKKLESHFKERKREYELLKHDTNLQPSSMIKPHLSQLPSYLLDDNLKKQLQLNNNEWNKSGTQQYIDSFNELPKVILNNRRKQKLRKRMKHDKILKTQVIKRRNFNRKHSLSNYANRCHKSDKDIKRFFFLNKSTLAQPVKPKPKDPKVYIKPKSWKRELNMPGIVNRKRKPGFRGMSKSQAKMLKKRMKYKKLANRRRK